MAFSHESVVQYAVTYLGGGTFSNVVRVQATRGSATWSFALGLSRLRSRKHADYQDPVREHRVIVIKDWADMIPELACGRLVATLRQPGFLPQYRAFVVDGPSFAQGRHLHGSLTAAIFEALDRGRKGDAAYWRDFQGNDVDVLIVCTGLGDAGTLGDDHVLQRTTHEPGAVRQWLFTLQWSLLVAERTFNFRHRDIKMANVVLSDEGAGHATFQFDLSRRERERLGLTEADAALVRHFRIEREKDTLSALVPKFIDLGFGSYAVTSVAPEPDLEPIEGAHNPPLYDSVNGDYAEVSTFPSPDLLFTPLLSNDDRDFVSDLFSLGVAALELMAGDRNYVVGHLFPHADVRNTFQKLCTSELQQMLDPPDRKRVRMILREDDRVLYAYMQMMHALHGQLLPPANSPLRQTLLYRILDRPLVRSLVTKTDTLTRFNQTLEDIQRVHGPDALAFLRACLTWDKSDRGVFHGSPRPRPETPGTLRLLWHPYFAPLRSSPEAASASHLENHYILKYRDPPTGDDATLKPARFARVAQRIVATERGLLRQVVDITTAGAFELEVDSLVGSVLRDNDDASPNASTMTFDEEEEELPAAKRSRTQPPPDNAFSSLRPLTLSSLFADEETL